MNAPIGHNSQNMDVFEANSTYLNDLYEEAKNWLDGEPIQSEEQAEKLAILDDNIMALAKALDDQRKEAVEPLNKAKQLIQDKYNPFIQKDKGKADLARKAIKEALAPYLVAKDEAKRKEAEKLRLEAEALEREAQAAMQHRDASNLEEVEAAEALVQQSKQAHALSKKAHNQSAAVKGEGRAKSIITHYEPVIEDVKAAATWAWKKRREEFIALILKIAKEEFATGNRSIDGIGVTEIKKVRG